MSSGISVAQQAFEARVLGALFTAFTESGVRYAVLRNYELLPRSVGARDVDIVVEPEDLRAVRIIVNDITQQMTLSYGDHFRDERLTQFVLVGRSQDHELIQIKLDFFVRSEVYGIEFLSASELLKNARRHNDIVVVSDLELLLDKWIFHLLVGQPLHSKYDEKFAAIARFYREDIERSLGRFLPGECVREQVAELAAGAASSLAPIPRFTRIRALARLWVSQGSTAPVRTLRFLWYRLRDRLRPHGVFMSISGPDGSGKTTVIELVISQLREIYGNDSVNYAHFRPKVLPRIAEVARKARVVEAVDEDYDRPHRARSSGMVGSLARLFYYWFDYCLGYFCRIHSVLRRREVMLYDRYFYDMIADSRRSRISLPMPGLMFAGWLTPLPHYAFFLEVADAEIYRRKRELTIEQIEHLNGRYSALACRGWLMAVDNNGAPERAASAIVDCIVNRRHQRALKALS